jgi:hypothetical protein
MSIELTGHGQIRLRQRGFHEEDLAILLRYGSGMKDGTLTLTNRDIEQVIHTMRQRITRIERLRGMTAVLANGRVITVYKNTRRRKRYREVMDE